MNDRGTIDELQCLRDFKEQRCGAKPAVSTSPSSFMPSPSELRRQQHPSIHSRTLNPDSPASRGLGIGRCACHEPRDIGGVRPLAFIIGTESYERDLRPSEEW